MSLTIRAPAKINLWLSVYAPDATGYHPLDTLFCALELADEITIVESANGLQLEVEGTLPGAPHDNLAYRAACEFFQVTGIAPHVHIHLRKRIPVGAGLGGGSSDAAAVLDALNALHAGALPLSDLLALAARLGSDVAFFLCGSALAHATGRGELLSPLPPLPATPMIVVAPDFAVATATAYRWLDEQRAYSSQDSAPRDMPRDWHDVARCAHNAFEPVLLSKHPALAAIKTALRDSGAQIALLSGSGSALFGTYASMRARDEAAAYLRESVQKASVTISSTRS